MSAALALAPGVVLRQGQPQDAAFILDSWRRSYRDTLPDVPTPLYDDGQRTLALALLSRSVVLVAADREAPDVICGYAVAERRGPLLVVHYVYVKAALRRFGIATSLLRTLGAEGCHYTHRTRAGRALARAFRGHFNPYLGVLP